MMLNANKLKVILACISLLLCITTVQQTYAKYVTSTTAGANMTIARWRILVNDEDIHTGNAMQEVIQPTFTGTDYIAEGVIAPTSEGYFDLVIDSTNTDLSFTYNMTAAVSDDSSVSDLQITGYSINNGAVTAFVGAPTITGDILYSNPQKTNTIRVFIKWNDETQSQNMNNTADTDASYDTENTPLLDVSLSFIQKNA